MWVMAQEGDPQSISRNMIFIQDSHLHHQLLSELMEETRYSVTRINSRLKVLRESEPHKWCHLPFPVQSVAIDSAQPGLWMVPKNTFIISSLRSKERCTQWAAVYEIGHGARFNDNETLKIRNQTLERTVYKHESPFPLLFNYEQDEPYQPMNSVKFLPMSHTIGNSMIQIIKHYTQSIPIKAESKRYPSGFTYLGMFCPELVTLAQRLHPCISRKEQFFVAGVQINKRSHIEL